jgi:single-stranded-DNA-specific exonuclease
LGRVTPDSLQGVTPSAAPPANAVSNPAETRPARPPARWIVAATPEEQAILSLTTELRLPDVVCRLLAGRGYGDPQRARDFLRPRLDQLHPPEQMLGMDAAVQRLAHAVRNGETIFLHGDYDVDGMCSTTLLTRAIRGVGGNAVPFIPRRVEDGYDLTEAGGNAAIAAGAAVVVTCDCGTSAREPVAALCRAGIDVIVTDHHLPGGPLPECLAVLNPRQPGCEYPDQELAAVGVAFKLALALVRELGHPEAPVFAMLDLVALATIADIAPLRGENRILARFGLRMLSETRNAGLRALIRSAGLDGKPLTAGRVGFILAPRLNAVGRLGHALRGVELLLSDDDAAANVIARELEELNRTRQEMDREMLESVRRKMDSLDLSAMRGLVIAGEGWHPGVIGIVASRVVEETGRPAVVIATADGVGKGSGRSIPAFDLHGALGACSDLLLRFGGHRAAAGLTVREELIPELARRFDEVACERLTDDDLVPELRVDLEIALGDASEELLKLLTHLEPHGVGNPGPVLMSRGVSVLGTPRRIGSDGVRMQLTDFTPGDAGSSPLDAIGWGLAHRMAELRSGRTMDIAFRLEHNEYRGVRTLQARVLDFREG